MVVNLRRLPSVIVLIQLGLILPVSAQQTQSTGSQSGTVTAAPGVTSSSAANTATTTAAPTVPTFSYRFMLPGGRLGTQRSSTVIVCDLPNAPFPDFVDICE
jgi:hypothetical protein